MAFSTIAFTACKSNNGGNTPGGETPPAEDPGVFDETATAVAKADIDDVHIFNVTYTDKDFIVNGATEYKVVVPEDSDRDDAVAANEFNTFFKEATGISIVSVKDTGLTHTADAKYISIGNTTLLESCGVEVDYDLLGQQGARAFTKDNTIYLCGGYDYGALFAVYDFFQVCFDYEFYYEDCWTLKHNVTNMKLPNLDVTDVPDMQFMSNGYYRLITGDWAYRARVPYIYGEKVIYIHDEIGNKSSASKGVHNSTNWVPTTMRGQHPYWFSTKGNDLCYTARGDEAEYQAMVKYCVEKAVWELRTKTDDRQTIMTFTMQDSDTLFCGCDACVAAEDRYGAKSGACVKFMNDLRLGIDAEMEKPENVAYKCDDLFLCFFAYMYFSEAPTKNLEEVTCVPGVGPYIAMDRTFDYQASVYAPINDEPRAILDRWKALSETVMFWAYGAKFSDYLYPLDTFSFFNAEAYTYFASFNPAVYYCQSQYNETGAVTAFNNLKAYLDQQLRWQSKVNTDDLIDDFMENMYAEAAPYMMELYRATNLQAAVIRQEHWNGITILGDSTKIAKAEYWPYTMVSSWLDILDKAYEAIAEYELTDITTYNKLKSHIDMEWVSPAYIMLNFYQANLPREELVELKATFKRIVGDELGMSQLREFATMDTFLATL